MFGCCQRAKELNNPPLPKLTTGWQKVTLGDNVTIYGDFVVYKRQSINDGKYGIEVVNLYPAKCSLSDNPGEDLPSAQLRFFKVSDNSTICNFRFIRGSTSLDNRMVENPLNMIWSVIEVNEVNTKENWVKFNLRLK